MAKVETLDFPESFVACVLRIGKIQKNYSVTLKNGSIGFVLK